MAKPEFSLFFHPTTTIYIDDNKDFLHTLTMRCKPGSFRIFTDPHEGLAFIESQNKLSEDFSKGLPLSPEIKAEAKLILPQNRICQKLNTLNRFAEPSVMVVDFSMPELNGLDLCSQISSPNTKKVLLTGVANERQAIHALNADLIDFYIGKNEEDLNKRLAAIVSTLNNRYFMDLMTLSNHEARQQMPFIFDTEFADYFEQICEDLDVIEYYYVTNPAGFLLIDKLGTIHRLVALLPADKQKMLDELTGIAAPDACLSALHNDEKLPFFYDHDGVFHPHYAEEWQTHSTDITTVRGDHIYLCALIEKHSKSLTCLQEYLDMPSSRLH